MLILTIDSTSYLPRVALVRDQTPLREISQTQNTIVWDDFRVGNGKYILAEYEFQLEKLWEETGYAIGDIDMVCYSGYSGFQKIIDQGKAFSEKLASKYNIPVIPVDHITSHDISTLIEQKETGQNFPILIFSASGSHNSFSLMQDRKTLQKLSDTTEFDYKEKKYVGLGNIFFRLVKSLNLFDTPSGGNNISEIISNLEYETSTEIIDFILGKYQQKDIYDTSFLSIFNEYKKEFIETKKYSTNILYFSFEEAIIRIFIGKFEKIYEEEKFSELHIVGGISANDTFFQNIKEVFKVKGIEVYRPLEKYRFDNASMLGVLACILTKDHINYEYSKIVTY